MITHPLRIVVFQNRAGDTVETAENCVVEEDCAGIQANIHDGDDVLVSGMFYQTGLSDEQGRAIYRQDWIH